MTLLELNRKYYVLYDELKSAQNSSNMPSDQYKAMCANIKREYDQDIEIYWDERELEFGMQRFELKFKVANYTPRRRLLFWWNPIAKKLLKQYKAELLTYLAALAKSTREEKNYADSLQQEPKAPSEQPRQLPEGQCTALTTPAATSPVEQGSPSPNSP